MGGRSKPVIIFHSIKNCHTFSNITLLIVVIVAYFEYMRLEILTK